MTKNTLEFMIRVKLPNPGAYSGSPSGDSQYEDDYNKAIFDIKPPGFEVSWPKLGHKWPSDSLGFTYVPLYISDEKSGLYYYIERVHELEDKLEKIKKAVG